MKASYNGKPPFQAHSATSRASAREIEPEAQTLQGRVLSAIRAAEHGGMTDEELQTDLEMNPSTQRPRRRELQLKKLIRDSGRTRRTKSGRKAVVWVAEQPEVQGELCL